MPWEATPPGRPDRWGRALDEMRFGLGRAEGEILELHHVRGLTIDELAYVMSLPVDEARRRLDAGAGYAKLLLEDVFGPDVPKVEDVLRDAFAVMPPTPAELAAAAKPIVVPLPPGTVIG
ncbi:MAG: hypothetical protein K8H88_30700, partial [Sandaracinaceae bacterium]|nr:hypothetical protein [Sandaracinaceae bacterium]